VREWIAPPPEDCSQDQGTLWVYQKIRSIVTEVISAQFLDYMLSLIHACKKANADLYAVARHVSRASSEFSSESVWGEMTEAPESTEAPQKEEVRLDMELERACTEQQSLEETLMQTSNPVTPRGSDSRILCRVFFRGCSAS
jgi:hypothetical protein